MFVRLQKDAKQLCDATKLDLSHCVVADRSVTSTMSMTEPCGITALFGIFLETDKHQNLTRLSKLVTNIKTPQDLGPKVWSE